MYKGLDHIHLFAGYQEVNSGNTWCNPDSGHQSRTQSNQEEERGPELKPDKPSTSGVRKRGAGQSQSPVVTLGQENRQPPLQKHRGLITTL